MKLRGFTLIELIIILVIIGILAVTAGPVFFDNSGTQSQVLRQQAMSILRNIQQQAMQDTTDNYVVEVSKTRLGIPPYEEDNNLQISNTGDISFSFAPSVPQGETPPKFEFDGLGRPTGHCENGCTITLSESPSISRSIRINKEGFIDAQ